MNDCEDLSIGDCCLRIGRPASHWTVTIGDSLATRRTNFRIRLLTVLKRMPADSALDLMEDKPTTHPANCAALVLRLHCTLFLYAQLWIVAENS